MSDNLEDFRLMLQNVGIPEDEQQEALDSISRFVAAMASILSANKMLAPNYLTFALGSESGDRYELTIRRSDGKTPCELIGDKQDCIDEAVYIWDELSRAYGDDEHWPTGGKLALRKALTGEDQ